jgi:hypothetical protein
MINLVKGTSPEDPGTYSFRLNLTQLFPGAAARTFETALYVFERYILGWDPKKKRPLRFVASYMFVVIICAMYRLGKRFYNIYRCLTNWVNVYKSYIDVILSYLGVYPIG